MSLKVCTENNSGTLLKDVVLWDMTLCRSSHCRKLGDLTLWGDNKMPGVI
jgi:hypothetical protein